MPWLARHAPHIEQLELRLREDGSASERIVSSVRGCFQALRSTQRLDHLSIRLSWGMPTFETGWLPPLPSLRRISLCNTLMMFSSAASDLPALQVLECLNIPWDAPEVVLPPTLTHIGLDGDRRSTLAEEVSLALAAVLAVSSSSVGHCLCMAAHLPACSLLLELLPMPALASVRC